jgi:hypothetical protein
MDYLALMEETLSVFKSLKEKLLAKANRKPGKRLLDWVCDNHMGYKT